MSERTDACDVLVVGSGAAGLSAACVAAAGGLKVLLAEASALVGGTTAISGGMVWIPANHHMSEAGRPDRVAAARSYLAHTVPPGDDGELLETFVQTGDAALRHLEQVTALRLRPVLRYPDYYPDLPGATEGGRVLEPHPFNATVLGPWFAKLRPPLPEFMVFGGMMVHRSDIPHLRRFARSPASAWRVLRLLARHARERLAAPRGSTLHLGNALAGWLLHSALRAGVDICTSTPVLSLHREGEGFGSATLAIDGRVQTLRIRRAVVLAGGGISHDATLRRAHVPASAGTLSATVASNAQASGAALAMALGARIAGGARQAFWVPASRFTRRDGSAGVFPHTVTDRGKPGLIAVAQDGRRFVNEALSYHEFVKGQLAAGPRALPAWLVCDRRFLWRYGLGVIQPFALSVSRHISSGNLKTGRTLAELAGACKLPSAVFEQTVAAFNDDARRGTDTQFGRGSDIYQRHLGDALCQPNPCLAPIEHAPYFAVAVEPADLGMAAGLATDANARVLGADGRPIPGLYACGNDMASPMNGAYPGPGITLGPALVFACRAAQDLLRG